MRRPRECRVSHHQPEMQPEGVPQGGDGNGDGAAASAGAAPGDLVSRLFPLGDWGEPAERLDELYRWVERGALDTAAWYLRDRTRKRVAARVLRGGAAVGALGAGVLPLLDLAGGMGGVAPWGFVSLIAGVACVGCDRFFGFTSGWMRDVATAQAVQRRLQVLQFDWASESVREVLGPTEGTASEAADRCLGVLRRFSEDVTELVRAETADWMVEFRAGSAPLVMQGAVPGGASGQPRDGAGPGRFPLPPGARPNMPRQRPPEPR
ncbi:MULTISPECIES: SLATT domain-containing protein [Streptomyces]|uniref:SLATT domain-containing protein n=1 Tax=Streptomyces TaxID=1883 RepID=UPI0013D962D0|nr:MULTISPECIES: SLATT domain-containing protein [Streptomyces]QIB44510.1 SLATT domain-containing protein [Streptomyces aureoverticillatus]